MRTIPECIPALRRALSDSCSRRMAAHEGRPCGQPHDHTFDAYALRRVAMQLRRWHDLECGVEGGGVERDEKTGKCFWYSSATGRRTPTPDRETGALKRLATIMARYPDLSYYVLGDPCGAAVWVLRPGDVPDGGDPSCYYTRGLAVYK